MNSACGSTNSARNATPWARTRKLVYTEQDESVPWSYSLQPFQFPHPSITSHGGSDVYNLLLCVMLRCGKADPALVPVKDAVILAKEGVAQDPP